ncbi:MAG: DegT/DnrJ/EryC1/StrS family aminotransferase [Pseudomonadota bacterium]
MKVAFIEEKAPDLDRVGALLRVSASENRWANRGPLYQELAQALQQHAQIPVTSAIVPLANGGIALEAMARFFDQQAGQKQRWVASAFSFRNIGRGYFHDALLLDCDQNGLLDLEVCARLAPDSFDGLIVTNPFGMQRDFARYAEFARRTGKALLIDNAAGFHTDLPDWPWQSFSFHHTKPYGAGEGGAALVPREHAEAIYALVDYASDLGASAHWLGNGKISDFSCAFILDRLEKAEDWVPRYIEQRERMIDLACEVGLETLSAPQDGIPLTSLPFLSPVPLAESAIWDTQHLTLGKYYKPLRPLPQVSEIYARLVNVPCHPDLARKSDDEILDELDRLMGYPKAALHEARQLIRGTG